MLVKLTKKFYFFNFKFTGAKLRARLFRADTGNNRKIAKNCSNFWKLLSNS